MELKRIGGGVDCLVSEKKTKRILDVNEQMKEVDFSYGKTPIPTLFHMKIGILGELKSK